MDREEQLYHLIDKYLENSLVGEDLDILKNRMKNDEAFIQQVALQKALRAEIILQREAHLKSVLIKAAKGNKTTPLWSSVWAKAAVAILVGSMGIFTFLLFMNPSSDLAQKEESNDSHVSEIEKDNKTNQNNGKINVLDSSIVDEEAKSDEKPSTFYEEENLLEKIKVVEDKTTDSKNKDKVRDAGAKKLTNMREEAEELDIDDDVEVQKDKLLGKRMVVTKVILLNEENGEDKTSEAKSLKDVKVEKKERKKLFKRKKEVEKQEETAKPVKPAKPTYIGSSGKEMNIEYWKNILNFKGYKYTGNTIVLYGLNHEAAIRVFEYYEAIYLKHNGVYYRIRITSKHLPFERVNTELTTILNTF